MGRQIEFVHVEEDILPFLAASEESGGCIVQNNEVTSPTAYSEQIQAQMSTQFSGYFVIPKGAFPCPRDISILSGTIVEFTNCRKGNALSRAYEVGRLFLAQTPEGTYDPAAAMLYDKMRAYIKRTYCYSKSAKIYYSPAFKKEYDRSYYYAARLGKRVVL